MKIALTGGTGFIGKRVVRKLRERGHEVVCVVRDPAKATLLSDLGATLARGDILDGASLKAAFAGCEGVFHIAASYELGVVGRRAREALAKNLEGTKTALEAARDAGAKKIVYTSSIVVYGNTHGRDFAEGEKPERIEFPSTHPTFYAMSKARAHYDIAVPMMEAGAPIVIVMPGGVFGPRDHSTFRIIWESIARGRPVVMGGARYGVVDVEDCAEGHVLAMEKGTIGQCYHLVDRNMALADLARQAMAASGVRGRVWVFPDWVMALNTGIMKVIERVIHVPDILSSDALRGIKKSVTLTVTHEKARAELGWTPRAMDDALRELMADELVRRGKKLTPLLEGVKVQA